MWVACAQELQPPDNLESVFLRSIATRLPPAAAGSTESASSVFNRRRTDIKRHTLKIVQPKTISPTRSDSAAGTSLKLPMSARSKRDRYVIRSERSRVRESEQIARHQQRVAPRVRFAFHY